MKKMKKMKKMTPRTCDFPNDVVLGDFGNICNFKDGCEAGYYKDPFQKTDTKVDEYTLSWQMALFILNVVFDREVSHLSQHHYDNEEIDDECPFSEGGTLKKLTMVF